ncbi:MAG TPA: hypothetical protein VH744_06935, partial [Terriglobales bacterium]
MSNFTHEEAYVKFSIFGEFGVTKRLKRAAMSQRPPPRGNCLASFLIDFIPPGSSIFRARNYFELARRVQSFYQPFDRAVDNGVMIGCKTSTAEIEIVGWKQPRAEAQGNYERLRDRVSTYSRPFVVSLSNHDR